MTELLPVLGTILTMALSVPLYARLYGASLAWGLVLTILVHELGHGAAARRLGLRVGAPVFIPLFGAYVALKDRPRSAWAGCLVAAAGPAAGLLAASVCAAAAALRPDAPSAGLLTALARITAALNLFNLVPAAGLDGDRITRPFAPAQWPPVLAALAAACVGAGLASGRPDATTILVLLGAAAKARRARGAAPTRLLDRLAEAGRSPADEDTTPERRRAAAAIYVGLALALAALSAWAGRRI